ncbi:hypothetical protein BV22DRAFT_701902 [Leucogyrophana mollusca]|uniref:Uncharacterized protein n=1 Tax=Leucogyrophana mollusca TaxID=85980 RepID=A0ACB8B8L6_9AGAM|nr:hypothetical protein BV22DRAFT_701902 [Leucogyrophana mollusca]
MRRIASVFVSKRTDRPTDRSDAPAPASSNEHSAPQRDPSKKKSRVFNSLSRRAVHPTLPQLIASDAANSSASSSSGSTTLPTPDEEHHRLPRTPSKKANWKSWLGGRKPTADTRNDWDFKPDWPPPLPTSALRPPQIDLSNDTDDASSQSDDESDHPEHLAVHAISPQSITKARTNLRTMITNSLLPQYSHPPLLDIPSGTSFPRSSNTSRHLSRIETTASKMHKALLLKRLDDLTRSDEHSIAPLGLRPAVTSRQPSGYNLDEDPCIPPEHVVAHCTGLAKWASRPCYEDRVLVWTREESSGNAICTRISGSGFGVAALEFSGPLETLAGLDADVQDFDPMAEASGEIPQIPVPVASPPKATEPRFSPPISLPAPTEPPPLVTPKPEVKEEASPPPAKRGVRFAEVDKEDQIPLGYVLRIKKKREEKAKFLLEEQKRRAHEEEKRKQEAERRQREAEKREWERERKAWEDEKRKIEEEKRQRAYAEEVHAARARRDASRAGQASSSSSLVRGMEHERSASRETRHSSPARHNSSHSQRGHAPELIVTASLPPYDGSPASSLPPTPGSQRSMSRPPSVYSAHTTSSEDVRARDGRRVSKRNSQAIDPSKHAQVPAFPSPRASLMPYAAPWTHVPPVPPLPQMPAMSVVPAMQFYPMDMPLLPPSPPFMMNQFGNRPRSYNGSQGHSSQSSPRQHTSALPRTNSAEAVHYSNRIATNPYGAYNSHQRRASDEAAAMVTGGAPVVERKVGSQPDLHDRRLSTAHSPPRSPRAYASNSAQQQSRRAPSALAQLQTVPAPSVRPVPMAYPQLPPTNRRQSVIS